MLFAGLPTVKQSSPLKMILSSNNMSVPRAEKPMKYVVQTTEGNGPLNGLTVGVEWKGLPKRL